MPDLTPPPMSDEHCARLLLELNALTADGPSEMFSLIVDRVSAARDEQWRQRLEAVAVVSTLPLMPVVCVPSGQFVPARGTKKEAVLLKDVPTNTPLYRIKEQG